MANMELIKLAEEKIGDNNKLQTFVERAKAVTIPLFPETVQFTDTALKFGAAIVSVSTELDTKGNNKDIYKNESGGYCLHLSKLNEIAQMAGLQITDSRIIERKTDEEGRVVYICHQVSWKIKAVDGSVKEGVTTGKYDYYNDLATKSEGQVKSRRKHAEALAESNALTRSYNKAIAKLPQSFTLTELKKPFLIPFVIEDKNELLKDLPPEVQQDIKRQVAMKRLGLLDSMYPQKSEIKDGGIDNRISDNNNPIPEPQDENTDIPEAIITEEKPTVQKNEENKIIASEFRDATQDERTEKILNLIKLKNYRDPNNVPITVSRIEKQPIESQIAFIEKLLNSNLNDEVPL